MLYLIFTILLICFGWKMLVLAVKLTWGITKIMMYIVVFPLFLVGLVLAGLVYLALPILVVAGIIALFRGACV